MELKPIEHQVAVVVGASSGIGRETALELAWRGARVVASARHEEGLESLVDAIRNFGGDAIAVPADASDPASMERLARDAADAYGRIDTWVHVAAVSLYARFEETAPEEFRRVVEVNLLGQMHGARAALPWLRRAGGGALIHVSSIEGLRALPYQAAYAASKHGIVGMLEALRLELRREGVPVCVTNVMPSSIDTPLFDKARTRLGVKPRGVPPMYEPQTVARAIAWAAEHPARDLIVGGAGRTIAFLQALSPRLVDSLLLRGGFQGQRTDEPKPASAPDNLDGPIGGFDRVPGDFEGRARKASVYTRVRTRPWIGRAAAGVAAGLVLGGLLAASGGVGRRPLRRSARRASYGGDDRYPWEERDSWPQELNGGVSPLPSR